MTTATLTQSPNGINRRYRQWKPSERAAHFAEYLRGLIQERGLTVSQMIRETGLPYSTLYTITNPNRVYIPDASVINTVADYFQVPRDDIYFAAGKIPDDIYTALIENPDRADDVRRALGLPVGSAAGRA